MKNQNIPVMVVFVVLSVILVISALSTRSVNFAESQLKITFLTSTLGGLIALMSAVLLLFRAASGQDFTRLLPLTLPLLAGVLIVSFHWTVAVTLGVLGLALLVRDMVDNRDLRSGED
jgi:hypothetical protein